MTRFTPLTFVLAASLLACGADTTDGAPPTPPPPEEPCPAPNRWVGDQCLEPGVQDDGCAAGTLGLEDGTCQSAGVPPELCAEGFEHDGDAVCEPILPTEACPEGLMAVPGDSACRPVMPCGAGTWGDIPVDGTTLYVDASYTGGNGTGSTQQPFTTINEAVAAASNGDLIAVAAGTYAEDVQLTKTVRLWGVCPDQVELAGTGAGLGGLDIRAGSSGSEVHGLAVTGGNVFAVGLSGAQDILLDQLWVHDGNRRGIALEDSLGPTSATLSNSLVEHHREVGVNVSGAEVTVDRVAIRDIAPTQGTLAEGRGLNVQVNLSTGTPAAVFITSCLLERNHQTGVQITGSQATVHGTVVRDTFAQQSDQLSGDGINVESGPDGTPATATITSTLSARNHSSGVSVLGSEVVLDGMVIRDNLPRPSDEHFGRGINIEPDPDNGTPSTVFVAHSLVAANNDAGVAVLGSQATIEGVAIRDTIPGGAGLGFGTGLVVQVDPGIGNPSTATIRGVVVERNQAIGLAIHGSTVTVAGLVVRDTLPRADDQLYGRGVSIGADFETGAMANATITGSVIVGNRELGMFLTSSALALTGVVVSDTLPDQTDMRYGRGLQIQTEINYPVVATIAGSLFEANHEFGVVAVTALVTFDGLVVRDTKPRAADGLFGDGIALIAEPFPGTIPETSPPITSDAIVVACRSEDNARAGLVNFGSDVHLAESTLACNPIDLAGEMHFDRAHSFDDMGGNRCGCPDPAEACKASSAELTPPGAVNDAP
jgi:Protein of unknown function (DUF1565)